MSASAPEAPALLAASGPPAEIGRLELVVLATLVVLVAFAMWRRRALRRRYHLGSRERAVRLPQQWLEPLAALARGGSPGQGRRRRGSPPRRPPRRRRDRYRPGHGPRGLHARPHSSGLEPARPGAQPAGTGRHLPPRGPSDAPTRDQRRVHECLPANQHGIAQRRRAPVRGAGGHPDHPGTSAWTPQTKSRTTRPPEAAPGSFEDDVPATGRPPT